MNLRNETFLNLTELFASYGFSLYLVGGTVRDILLNKDLDDMDAVTDATPAEMKLFLKGDYTFSRMGSVKVTANGVKFDITTLRKESNYDDSRHPQKIKFVKTPKEDFPRRDFTINAMYMDKNFKLIDYVNGEEDLNNCVLRMVGNPIKRLKEDPLRIIRALRFSLTYRLTIDERLEKALIKSTKYLDLISKEKIKMEIKKIVDVPQEEIEGIFKKYSINNYLDVIE